MAQAFVQKQDMPSAQMALDHAKNQFLDSPVLHAKSLFSAARIHENLGQVQEAAVMLKNAREICNKFGMTIHEINAILQQAALSFKTQNRSQLAAYSTEELENLISRANKSGDKQQLVNSLSLALEAAIQAGRYDQGKPYSDWLWRETEALSRLYDQEQRLIFFQHSTYENVKAAIMLDIRLRNIDSAFAKLDYVKSRALQRKIAGLQTSKATISYSSYANIEVLRKQLRSDEAIVDYMVTEDTLYGFVLTSSQLKIFPSAVTRLELRANVLEYLAQLSPDDQTKKDYDEQRLQQEFIKTIQLSYFLCTKLLGEMAGLLEKINRLYIVPDEFLHALPFNTLALQGGVEPEFLIEQKAIMYLPAASLLSNEDNASMKDFTRYRLLASVDSAMYGAPEIADGLAKLVNEKVSLKMHWENPKALKTSLASRYQAFFFYAHAEANWDDPWQSYIQFPLQQSRQYGKLTYADVDSIDWRNAALVILAGCETTGNRIYSGAGLSGLQRSFLGGGARQVLATFWKVDAALVAWQMSKLLEEWHRHGDAVLALQKMQQFCIAKLKADPYLNNCPHPRYWGAYNLIGTKLASYSSL
jgi:CHAT domain-containing protein